MRVDLLNDNQRRRVGTHLPFVPALKGGLGLACALKGAPCAEPGLQPTDRNDRSLGISSPQAMEFASNRPHG